MLKKYEVLTAFTLNDVEFKPGQTVKWTTQFKGTNSKNLNYLPADLIQFYLDNGWVKETP